MMNNSFLILFFVVQLFCSSVYADVIPEENATISFENAKNGSEDTKPKVVLIDQNNIQLSPNEVKFDEIGNSQRQIYELSLIIENQRKALDKLESKQEELKSKLTEQKNTNVSMDYTNWVSLLLGCVSALVTIFGVVMAIISFIGIKNIKTATNNIAQNVSTNVAKKVAEEKVESHLEEITVAEISKLISDGTLRPHLEQAVDMILRSNNLIQGSSGFNQFPEIDEDLDNESV